MEVVNRKDEAEYEEAQQKKKEKEEADKKRGEEEKAAREREADDVAEAWAKGGEHADIALGESAFEPGLSPTSAAEKKAYLREVTGGAVEDDWETPKGATSHEKQAGEPGRENIFKMPPPVS